MKEVEGTGQDKAVPVEQKGAGRSFIGELRADLFVTADGVDPDQTR